MYFVRDCSVAGSADDWNYMLTYLLIVMISNYFQTNTNSKSDEHVEANVEKRSSLYFWQSGNIKQLEQWSSG